MAFILSLRSVLSVTLRAQLYNEVLEKQNDHLHPQLCRWGFPFPGSVWAPPASDPDNEHFAALLSESECDGEDERRALLS